PFHWPEAKRLPRKFAMDDRTGPTEELMDSEEKRTSFEMETRQRVVTFLKDAATRIKEPRSTCHMPGRSNWDVRIPNPVPSGPKEPRGKGFRGYLDTHRNCYSLGRLLSHRLSVRDNRCHLAGQTSLVATTVLRA